MSNTSGQADLIVHARWILPIEGDEKTLNHHALVIRDGLIIDLLPSSDAERRWSADETLMLDRHALMPGFVNAHTHAAMNLFRGLADDLPLMTWLSFPTPLPERP